MCLDRLKVLDPCFSTVSRTIRSPRKTIRMDIVIADPEQRWIVCARAKLLFNMHFRAFPLTGTQVLQPGSFLSRHQLPLLLSRIVCTESSGHVVRLAAVPNNTVFIDDVRVVEPGSTPVASKFPVLLVCGGELPVAQKVIEIVLMNLWQKNVSKVMPLWLQTESGARFISGGLNFGFLQVRVGKRHEPLGFPPVRQRRFRREWTGVVDHLSVKLDCA